MTRLPRASSLILLALTFLLLGYDGPAEAFQGGVEVRGRVINGSPGGSVPPGLPVTLHVFTGLEEIAVHDVTLADSGSFCFDSIPLKGGENLVARLVYQDVAYVSDVVRVDPGRQSFSLPITIYETSEDVTSLLITEVHILLSRVNHLLQVGEHYVVSNPSDRTCVGARDPETGKRATLRFTLPDGAENLRFDGPGLGDRFLERAEGFADTRPVPPGNATVEVFFRYDLPFRGRVHLERAFDLPVLSAVLVLPEGEFALEGNVTPAGTFDGAGTAALSYAAGPLEAGEPLAFTLIAASEPASTALAEPQSAVDGVPVTVFGVSVLAVSGVVAFLLLRSPVHWALPSHVRPLVEAIAVLDERFEAGELSDESYHQQRESLKAQVRALLQAGGRQRVRR